MTRSVKNNETTEHLLLNLAKTYPVFEGDLTPEGCRYDLYEGAWILEDVGSLLVESPDRKGPRTKKEDIETGEDQKGE